jgi:hypothetical protein
MCCVDAFHRLGVQGVEGYILVGALFTPIVVPVSRRDFGVRAQAICFCIIVAILELPPDCFINDLEILNKCPFIWSLYPKEVSHLGHLHSCARPYL